MARLKAFRGLRPAPGLAEQIAELPYDVVSSDEAREIARNRPLSFYHVTKPEIDLPETIDLYDDRVYDTAQKNLRGFIEQGRLRPDGAPALYLYSLSVDGREQTGLVACVHIDDYANKIVKRHELTREDKERDRTRHMAALGAQAGLVYLFYREDGSKADLFARARAAAPECDFTAPGGVRHVLRALPDAALVQSFVDAFANDVLYIADGHHRAASAVRLGRERRSAHDDGSAEHNWFMAAIFPHAELRIMAYNRVVRDLNGLSPEAFRARLGERFTVTPAADGVPSAKGRFCVYLDGAWLELTPRFAVNDPDPAKRLDVRTLQDELLGPILGIDDPRTSTRIDFVGGIRGTGELERLVASGEFRTAISMYPTSIEELMAVSDADGIMPPKSTWFEPKLLSGLVLHQI
ncbi:MAG TPA: DUF1015 family protein [Spirochaetota bacterium]|nr:DUF1015 family protein [Spirochaetota bacterium]HNT12920.1 DUF1015 family protein [Spirochaetota bacterium]